MFLIVWRALGRGFCDCCARKALQKAPNFACISLPAWAYEFRNFQHTYCFFAVFSWSDELSLDDFYVGWLTLVGLVLYKHLPASRCPGGQQYTPFLLSGMPVGCCGNKNCLQHCQSSFFRSSGGRLGSAPTSAGQRLGQAGWVRRRLPGSAAAAVSTGAKPSHTFLRDITMLVLGSGVSVEHRLKARAP